MSRILFSPIGNSDPINAGHDGSWLHCCRHYQPDSTVIYLSSEMTEREERDKRFSKTLELLNRSTGHSIALYIEQRPELNNPHRFDLFYDDFEKILTDIHRKDPSAEILVNISSGTTAMKSALFPLYHMLTFPIKLIQVDGPHSEMNDNKGHRATNGDSYNIGEEWENNLDNLPDADNRCHVVKDEQQACRLRLMQIQALVRHNEFYAASLLADELDEFVPSEAKECLRAAAERQQLNLYSACLTLKKCGYDGVSVIQQHSKELLFQAAEMVLTMQCDLERDDIAGCVRKLTPVLFALMVSYLKKTGVDITRFVDDEYRQINELQMKRCYPELYEAAYKDGLIGRYLNHEILLGLIKLQRYDQNNFNGLESLRNIERNVRNAIAHKPVKLTESVFCEQAKKTPGEMMKEIRKLFECMDPRLFNNKYWKSYDDMKEFLMKKMQRM